MEYLERSAEAIGKVPPPGATKEVGFRALALPSGKTSLWTKWPTREETGLGKFFFPPPLLLWVFR